MTPNVTYNKDKIVVIDDLFLDDFSQSIIDAYDDSWEKISQKFAHEFVYLFGQEAIEGNEKRQNICKNVPKYFLNALKIYNNLHEGTSVTQNVQCRLTRYTEGAHCKWHWDYFDDPKTKIFPKVSCSVILSDYEGGELCFRLDDGDVIEMPNKIGRVILWPSEEKYYHMVKPVISGTRFSIVAWFA